MFYANNDTGKVIFAVGYQKKFLLEVLSYVNFHIWLSLVKISMETDWRHPTPCKGTLQF